MRDGRFLRDFHFIYYFFIVILKKKRGKKAIQSRKSPNVDFVGNFVNYIGFLFICMNKLAIDPVSRVFPLHDIVFDAS